MMELLIDQDLAIVRTNNAVPCCAVLRPAVPCCALLCWAMLLFKLTSLKDT